MLVSRLQKVNLAFPYFFYSYFHFHLIYFHFSIFRTLGLGLEVIDHTVTSVISNGMVTTIDYET